MSGACLEWRLDPWRERPAQAAAGLASAFALCALAVALRLPFVMTLVLCVASVAPLAVAFLPMRYRLDETGITRACGPLAERRSWERLRRAVRARDGILLTPFRARSWLDGSLGLFLPIPREAPAPLAQDLDRILASHGL